MPDDAAVIDSTVWISALKFGGIPRRALDLALQNHTIACCGYIRSEVQRTLVLKFGWDAASVRTEMNHYIGSNPDIVPPGRLRGVCRDPNDDLILECAVVAKARLIISGDRDLIVLNPYAGISILSPRQFLDSLTTP